MFATRGRSIGTSGGLVGRRGAWPGGPARVGRLVLGLLGMVAALGGCRDRAAGTYTCDRDGVCEWGETVEQCPEDCLYAEPVCGDGVCDRRESAASCPEDCGDPSAQCGNGLCEAGESRASCPADCDPATSTCGNGICDGPETAASCPNDCASLPFFGDGCDTDGNTSTCDVDEDPDGTFQGPLFGDVGTMAAIVGDLDGDGLDELAIGAQGDSTAGARAGAVYLYYGRTSGWDRLADMSRVDLRILGERAYDAFGYTLARLGDSDGDGLDDLLVGAPAHLSGIDSQGSAYLIYGSAERGTGDLVLAGSGPVNSYLRLVEGPTVGTAAGTLTGVGDVDGDGLADLAIGSPGHTSTSHAGTGVVYLVRGSSDRFDGTWGTAVLAEVSTTLVNDDPAVGCGPVFGAGAPGRGDLDGDGFDDFVLGCQALGEPGGGRFHVFYGAPGRFEGGLLSIQTSDATLVAEGARVSAGITAALPGDLDGDGYADLSVVVESSDDGTQRAVHVIYGAADRFAGDLLLPASLAGPGGPFVTAARISGPESVPFGGGQVLAGAWDVNGDGFDDLLIAAVYPAYEGSTVARSAALLFLGGSLRLGGELSFSSASAAFLVPQVPGDPSDCARAVGSVVAGGGDVNGDGFDDFLAGEQMSCDEADDAGNVFLIFGVGN